MLVDITKDALQARSAFTWPTQLDLPGYRPVIKPHGKQVREAARLIRESAKPVLYVGGGVLKAEAAAELKELAELTGVDATAVLPYSTGVIGEPLPQDRITAKLPDLAAALREDAIEMAAHAMKMPSCWFVTSTLLTEWSDQESLQVSNLACTSS